MTLANKIMKRSLLLFGPGPGPVDLQAPVGLSCACCAGPIARDASGVVYERGQASYAAHADCFARRAARDYLASFGAVRPPWPA